MYQQSGRHDRVGGMKDQSSLEFSDMINQKQNKTNRKVKIGTKFKFLIEITKGLSITCFMLLKFEPGLRSKSHGLVQF
jgi:hypothetical protein